MVAAASAGLLAAADGISAADEAAFASLSLKGLAGERLAACERNLVAAKDADDLAFPFTQKTESGSWDVLEPGIWQTEFWGKWMHAAVPMCVRSGDPALRARIEQSVKTILGAQLPDGYIGNYRGENRGDICDVWGCKYVMMGLLHWYDATGDKAALEGARRLADWLMAKFGPGKRSLGAEGPFNGLMNCSVLEPVVWTYRRTQEKKYLDFAKWIVSELDANADGPEIFAFAAKRTPLKACKPDKGGAKAYEKMSCCQGLLDYYLETGDARCLETVKAIAEQAIAEEIDITGGGTQYERFCGFRKMQTRDCWIASEMCVIITWMRLCEKLLAITGEAKWADEIERSFYNAYLAGLSSDGSSFASYGGLGGTREHRHPRQCRMEENCCNANGPRGFLSFCGSIAQAKGDEIWLSQYVLGRCTVPCAAAKGGKVVLDQFNDYPRKLESALTLALEGPATFTLHLRAPAWSTNTLVRVSDGTAESATAGGWITLCRTWQPGDQLKITFDGTVKAHEQDGHVAFTRGPVVLARDMRFADGDQSESVVVANGVSFCETMPPDASMHLGMTALLKTGCHSHPPRPVGFCDFASAGNTDDRRSFYRVWLPVRADAANPSLKVLAIGNSFTYSLLNQWGHVSQALGEGLDFATLCIGGCTLERHAKNIRESEVDPALKQYDFDRNTFGVRAKRDRASIPGALQRDRWDVVVIQQASNESWRPESFQPWAGELVACIRRFAPQARIAVQQTWSYSNRDKRICEAESGGAGSWGFDQEGMFERLKANYRKLADDFGCRQILTGEAIQRFRAALPVTSVDDDVVGRGEDSIHLNPDGDYLQALVWSAALFGDDVSKCTYVPEGLQDDPNRAELIRRVASDAGHLAR